MRKNQSGQILLVILLIMIVGLTIGLFLLGRTTTDISLTTKVSDSSRAFNAAEAGIEETIRSGATGVAGAIPTPVSVATGVTYSVNSTGLGTSGTYPAERQGPVQLGYAFTVWLVGHNDTDGTINISTRYGGSSIYICFTTNTTLPSIGVNMIYQDGLGAIRSSYAGYDAPGRSPVTPRFEAALNNTSQCPTGTTGYNFYASVQFLTDFANDPLLPLPGSTIPIALRIRSLYAPSSIAVQPVSPGVLPKQGNDITSTGNVGEVTRRINVKKPYTVPPPFIDYALYSTGINIDLTHN